MFKMFEMDAFLSSHSGGFTLLNKWLVQPKSKVAKLFQVNILEFADSY